MAGNIRAFGLRGREIMTGDRRWLVPAAVGALIATGVLAPPTSARPVVKTLLAVWAHADDEAAAGPVLARYARDGAQVFMIIVTDGAQGGAHTSIPRGPALARVRAEEARCAADALGVHPPILLGFPDAELGSYMDDRERLARVSTRIQEEMQRLRPDGVITWGPEGGGGHPDHRLVSSIVTQLVRAGAPGAPERLFYGSLPVEGMRAVNPTRAVPTFIVPQAKYLTVTIPFTPEDLEAFGRSMACHKTQYSGDLLERIAEMMQRTDRREWPLSPWIPMAGTRDLFGD